MAISQPQSKSHDPTSDAGKLAVLNIQRTCVHDGPGIRSTIFFRGCTLRCLWCQNPEARAFVAPSAPNSRRSITDIMGVISKDREYYANTHGGVTLSGGEPLAQKSENLVRLLESLKSENLHVAVETAGDVPWSAFEACLPMVDLFLFDLKAVGDDELHKRLTGRDGIRVERNLRKLVEAKADIQVRTCVVPDHNDTKYNFEATADLLNSIGRPSIELMRYYSLHEKKAKRLAIDQEPLNISTERSLQAINAAADAFTSLGIEVRTVEADSTTARRSATFTRRVHDIQQAIRKSGYALCLETAGLKTKYHKKHGFSGPLPIRRANLLRYLLNNKKTIVYPHELLVGNFTSKRVGATSWVEYFGSMMVVNLWNIDRQKPIGFRCSLAEKLRFYTRIAPFWLSRGLLIKAFPSLKDLGFFIARTVEKKAGFNNNLAGIAHYIVNCDRILQLGTRGIAAEIEEKRKEATNTEFYDGLLIALKSLEEFAARYAEKLSKLARHEPDSRRRSELEQMAKVCARVPQAPARTFHEALQSILFLQIALCTESFENAISLGRLDQSLYPYYKADVEAGKISYDSAKELVACFILKIDEVIFLNDGDTGFEMGKMFESLSPVETVTVGGVDKDGADCTNDVTYMILEACELKPIGVNMAARIHRHSPADYVARIAEVYLNGSPMPALYNDEVYIEALRNEYDTTLEDARNYSIVGCVEPVASDDHFANTDAANINVAMPFVQALTGSTRPLWRFGELSYLEKRLSKALRSSIKEPRVGANTVARIKEALKHYEERLRKRPNDPPTTMAQLMERFEERLNELVRDVLADQQRIEKALAENLTTPLASSLYRGCIESGKDVYEGGTTFNTSGIQAVGVTDVADSLAVLDEFVFRKQQYSIDEMLEALDTNFRGDKHQKMRGQFLAVPKFGDDTATEAPKWVNQVLEVFVAALRKAEHKNRNGKYVAGYYGLNVNMVYGRRTPALPSGRLRGLPLAKSKSRYR